MLFAMTISLSPLGQDLVSDIVTQEHKPCCVRLGLIASPTRNTPRQFRRPQLVHQIFRYALQDFPVVGSQ